MDSEKRRLQIIAEKGAVAVASYGPIFNIRDKTDFQMAKDLF